jgi:hypothetical protein
MKNPKEGSCNPEATIGLDRGQFVAQSPASEQEVLQLRDLSQLYNFALQLDSTALLYNSTLALNSSELSRDSPPSTTPSARQETTLPTNLGNLRKHRS